MIIRELEIKGTYGSSHTPCTVFTYGGWYVVAGSVNVNRSHEIEQYAQYATDRVINAVVVDVEMLSDYDCFTVQNPIESLEDLVNAVES